MTLPPDLPLGTVLESPVAAIDWDPRDSYQMRFWLEDSHKGFILLDDSPRVVSKNLIPGSATWQKEQLPTVVRIQVTGPYKLPLTLRVIAQDSGKPARRSTTFINLLERLKIGSMIDRVTVGTVPPGTTQGTTQGTTTQLPQVILDSEVTKEKALEVVTDVPEAPEAPEDVKKAPEAPEAPESETVAQEASEALEDVTVAQEAPEALEDVTEAPEAPEDVTEASEDSEDVVEAPEDAPEPTPRDQKLISDLKKALNSLITSKKPTDNEDSDFDAIAFASKTSHLNAIETEDTADQIEAFGGGEPAPSSRFAQCSLRIDLMENSPNGTEVAKLEVVNWRNVRFLKIIFEDHFIYFEDFSASLELLFPNEKKNFFLHSKFF